MLCNAAVQKYHNFRIQLDFFLFWQNFFLKPRRREASWLQQKVVQNALATIIFDVWMSFKGVLDTMGSIDSKTVNGMGFLQCLIIRKPIFNVDDWHCVLNVVDRPWELKKIKNKKKNYMGPIPLASKTLRPLNISHVNDANMSFNFFRNRGFGIYERGGLA